ncbi:MAG: CehA/McbA family metallohydrolase [Caulobacteraceae bacterium]|nr:CehA/McbA family metallohydrolase [Caulobacteraceae bacterium]
MSPVAALKSVRTWLSLALLAVVAPWIATTPALAADRTPDVVLEGEVRGGQSGADLDLPFTVPAGTAAVRVVVDYPHTPHGAILYTGLYDPQRFRGWGGGIKTDFTVAEAFASPSFNLGPIPPGVWRLAMGVAFAGRGPATPYQVKIYFSRATDMEHVAFANAPLRTEAGWYRGDLHAHTGDSDGACLSLGGRPAPCPAFFTLQSAVDRGLDFVAVTDHNVTSHFGMLGGLQAYFDTLLVLPGREITTRFGHANLIGPMGDLEIGLGRPGAEDMTALLKAAKASGGFLSINHPALASGEDCLGCGWTADIDYGLVQGVEAVNGGTIAEAPPGAQDAAPGFHIPFWQERLNAGHRLIGVGGSDNHDPRQALGRGSPIGPQSPLGYPATVVYARELSQVAILDGLRSGRVFVDLRSGRGRVLDLSARLGGASAVMGGTLAAPARGGGPLTGDIHVMGAKGGKVELIVDGAPRALASDRIDLDDWTTSFRLADPRGVRWFRVNVRDPDGRLAMVGNPIFLDHGQDAAGRTTGGNRPPEIAGASPASGKPRK